MVAMLEVLLDEVGMLPSAHRVVLVLIETVKRLLVKQVFLIVL